MNQIFPNHKFLYQNKTQQRLTSVQYFRAPQDSPHLHTHDDNWDYENNNCYKNNFQLPQLLYTHRSFTFTKKELGFETVNKD